MKPASNVLSRKLRRFLTYWSIFATNLIALAIGISLIFVTQTPWRDVGTSLVASGIIGWFSLYVVKVQENQREGARRLLDTGIIDIYPDRSDKTIYKQYLDKCEKQLDILAESLTRFYTDFKDVLPVLDQRGVTIRLLILDPESTQCTAREKEEHAPERMGLSAKIKQQTAEFQSLKLKHLRVRWYWCTPSVNYFRADDFVFFGSYFVGIISRNSLTFLGRITGSAAVPYTQHFEKVWSEFSREPK